MIPFSKAKLEASQEFILLTYREGIPKILPTTYFNTDSGWGCMLRVGQMFLANLYFKLQKKTLFEVVGLFNENKPQFFSLPNFIDTATKIYPHKKPYEWFSPCECGFIIKELLDNFDSTFRTSICNDNCIFLNEIVNDRENLVVMAMCRIGLDQPQKQYLECVLELMKNKHFNSILGGTPKKAHLFIKNVDGYLGFLDPHRTQKVTPLEQLHKRQNEYLGKLEWVKQEQIDCSMAIAFIIPKQELSQFWESLQKTKQKMGESFFIYLEKERPVFDSDDGGIIQLCDDDEEEIQAHLKKQDQIEKKQENDQSKQHKNESKPNSQNQQQV